ncbi:His-Xaa-Ser system radical SAM maturase HxsB [Paradevosia shaoguanensis]|uniref:His-Xaa-Ser system radical SAM maturase HxsB n=1 Tax=Paradevosia shaoguanensis TaxID=1335043 RepID=A0AA41UAD2_9HYPH|nr:His-Xaa-Ser system radical SAM maturase HxsB [Paradevosia shaoguanensis]MCF1741454.1 His-Xaa-Ser system radical SAM maturase HxsB [Paradevosia shaoguanensis]MCI0125937.1 His-Xaa-Ser system radical SAM maturase HxsB [Paradevosia shaoguanensis]
MTTVWPLRFRELGGDLLFADEAGGWFYSDRAFLDRYALGELTSEDQDFLLRGGFAFNRIGDLSYSSFLRRWSGRHASMSPSINYVILVPTLRCNLSCEYCQVSRAAIGAQGYDWSEETLEHALAFLDRLTTGPIKIEFQGGEPLLRIDILERVREFCRSRFEKATFVVCSNFQMVDDRVWAFFADEDTHLSTSIDGDVGTHSAQRTFDPALTNAFFENVAGFIDRYGPDRVSALPTIDLHRPFSADALIDQYLQFGLTSIYLRPVNRQGFARRKAAVQDEIATWSHLHERFIDRLIERNYDEGLALEEYYFTHALRRVLRLGINNHVDLRNPNILGDSYIVVDHDGTLYPTDEARMMSRVGQIDLSIGNLQAGLDRERLRTLNAWSFNDLDPDCQHCPYQAYCGTDAIDDVSRYGRIDLPRFETWFCNRHLALFDLIFRLLRSDDPKVQHSLALWAGINSWPKSIVRMRK